jgi:TolB protein
MNRLLCLLSVLSCGVIAGCTTTGTGGGAIATNPFEHSGDVGKPSSVGAGSTKFDAKTHSLTVTGGGANVWTTADNMQFAWKKMKGDISFSTDLAFAPATQGADVHRKAVVMIRQSLDTDSAYADATVHGNGMTALQWREAKGDRTYQLQANTDMPKRVRIEKRGDYFAMYVGTSDADMHPVGGECKISLTGEFYVGVGVCSHNVDRLESATFSNVSIAPLPEGATSYMVSTLQVYQDNNNRDRKAIWTEIHPATPTGQARMEAPNWTKDSQLLYNYNGRMFEVPAVLPGNDPTSAKIEPKLVDLNILTRLNNDHVLSFDGTMLVVSDQSQGNRQSTGWTIPLKGGTPTKVTQNTPAYMHGWSPDGKTLVFAASRTVAGSPANWDIYAIPSNGGPEVRLTTAPAREDGPEYSPDGQWIYFNSARTGMMQIWRMRPDGSGQEQVTNDTYNNWFPHISPNGRKMVYIAFDKSTAPEDHDGIKDVELHLMDLSTKQVTVIVKTFGGQGTINVPSWSQDSNYFAFMSYQLIKM